MYIKRFSNAKIISKIGRDPLTPAAVAEKVVCSQITIVRALPRLEEAGLVEKVVIKGVNGKKITGYYTDYNDRKKRKRGFINAEINC